MKVVAVGTELKLIVVAPAVADTSSATLAAIESAYLRIISEPLETDSTAVGCPLMDSLTPIQEVNRHSRLSLRSRGS